MFSCMHCSHNPRPLLNSSSQLLKPNSSITDVNALPATILFKSIYSLILCCEPFSLYILLESAAVTRHLWSSHKEPGGISTACRLVVLLPLSSECNCAAELEFCLVFGFCERRPIGSREPGAYTYICR